MDQDCTDIWQHILRLGIDKYNVRVLELLFNSPRPLFQSEINVALNYQRWDLNYLLDNGWIERKNGVKAGKVIKWMYGIVDLNYIIKDIDYDLEQDYVYQKALVKKSVEWINEHSKENNRNRSELNRVGRPKGRTKRKKSRNL